MRQSFLHSCPDCGQDTDFEAKCEVCSRRDAYNPLPRGLRRWKVILKTHALCVLIVASTPTLAWQKYCTQYFKYSPLKPVRTDYEIELCK